MIAIYYYAHAMNAQSCQLNEILYLSMVNVRGYHRQEEPTLHEYAGNHVQTLLT